MANKAKIILLTQQIEKILNITEIFEGKNQEKFLKSWAIYLKLNAKKWKIIQKNRNIKNNNN